MHDLAKKAPGLDRAQEADNSRLRVYKPGNGGVANEI
jgi:hypothetical protein